MSRGDAERVQAADQLAEGNAARPMTRPPASSSTLTLVDGTTVVSPRERRRLADERIFLIEMVRLPCAIATVETFTFSPMTTMPELSSMTMRGRCRLRLRGFRSAR